MPAARDRLHAAFVPLKFAVWFGLIAGAARALHYVILRATTDGFQWTGDLVVWLAPPGHVAILLIPALALTVAAAIWPTRISRRFVIAVLAPVALYSFLLLFSKIHHLALLAVAVGAGIQIARYLTRAPERADKWLGRTSAAIAVATLLAAIVVPTSRRMKERRLTAALPAAAPDSPNVLLVIMDAVRASRLHLYGHAQPTSARIEQLAAEGVVFDRAMATSSWTLASVASMETGLYPMSLSADWLVPLDDRHPVLAEALRDRGYLTGVFSANLDYMTRETGLGRGFMHFDDFRSSIREMLLTVSLAQSTLAKNARSAIQDRSLGDLLRAVASFNWARPAVTHAHERKPAEKVAQAFLTWQQAAGERPWFAMLNFFDAHAPYKAQSPFDTMFARAGLAGAYDGAIATIDRELGRMLDELRGRGALDRTIVIVTADHGELLGEHGWEHGNSLYMHLLHVPLVIRAPSRAPASVRVRPTVSLRDLAATVLDLVDPRSSDGPQVAGQSLRSFWDSTAVRRPSPALAALTVVAPDRSKHGPNWDLYALVNDSLHYIRNRAGQELLFDARTDPDEQTNLNRTEAGRALSAFMRARMDSAMRTLR